MKMAAPSALILTREEPASDGLDAAKDILEAISDKDPEALDMALRRHYADCAQDESEEPEEEE